MEEIRNTVISACTVSACISLIASVSNGTRLGKSVRFIGDLVLALLLITPFINGASLSELSLMPVDTGYSSYVTEEQYRQTVCREAEDNLRSMLCAELESAGIEYEEIEPEMHIDEQWNICIDRVRIKAGSSDAAEAVRSYLGEETEVLYDVAEKNP
ncbi:MAG: hypothetical protein J5501_07110 [Ruminococcus sp.]|nr:hypothetical protein [Ruminococcus sp.]